MENFIFCAVIIPSNIKKGLIPTHVFDSIDWINKALDRIETHHANSILVQKYDLVENLSSVFLDADYNFMQSWNHQSYKGSNPVLPNFCLKSGSAKRLKYTPVKNREECMKSSLYSLLWAHARILKGKQRVPSWSGFYELVSKPGLELLLGTYHPYLFHQQKPKLLQQRLEELRISRKNLKCVLFSARQIKLYTRKYLIWCSH